MQNASKNRWASHSLRQMVIKYRTVVIIRSTRLSCLRSEFLHPLVVLEGLMTSGIYVFAAALDASMVELSGLCERAILDVWGECSYYTMAETGSATWVCLKSDAPALLAPAPTRKLKLDQVLIDATSERFAYLPTKPRPALNAPSGLSDLRHHC